MTDGITTWTLKSRSLHGQKTRINLSINSTRSLAIAGLRLLGISREGRQLRGLFRHMIQCNWTLSQLYNVVIETMFGCLSELFPTSQSCCISCYTVSKLYIYLFLTTDQTMQSRITGTQQWGRSVSRKRRPWNRLLILRQYRTLPHNLTPLHRAIVCRVCSQSDSSRTTTW